MRRRTAEPLEIPCPTPEASVPMWPGAGLARLLGAAAAWSFAVSTFHLLPTYLVRDRGAGPAETGLVVGAFGLATVLCTPLAGLCVDRFPRRHALTLGALAMACAALGFVVVGDVGAIMIALRIVQGASYALVVTAVSVLVTELAPPARLSQALGLSGASMLAMNAVAPAVAEPLAALAGWGSTFALAALASLAAAVLGAGVAERPLRTIAERGRPALLLRRPVVRDYALVMTLAGAGFGAVFTYAQPYALALGRVRVAGFFAAFAITTIGARVLCGSLPDRLGRHRVAVASLAAYGLVVLAMAALRPPLFEVLGALFGLPHAFLYPALNAIVVTAVAARERGRVMAVFTGAFSLGVWLGTMPLGLVAERAGYPAVFLVAAAGIALALALLATSPALRAAGGAGQGAGQTIESRVRPTSARSSFARGAAKRMRSASAQRWWTSRQPM